MTILVDPLDGIPLTEEELQELEQEVFLESPDDWYVNNLSEILARTNKVTCGQRLDFYRWKGPNGETYCFANPGTLTYTTSTDVVKLCPGANKGRTYYKFNGTNYWSQWRGPETNQNICYSFGQTVKAYGVNIGK